jgi:uncharacterized protein (DUF1330 family)
VAKGYIIARVTVHDDAAYMEYAKRARVVMAEYGAKILVLGGRNESLQGEARQRNVVLEFESFDQAKAYYNSPGYQAAREFRVADGVSEGEFLLIEGFDGPQPGEAH